MTVAAKDGEKPDISKRAITKKWQNMMDGGKEGHSSDVMHIHSI